PQTGSPAADIGAVAAFQHDALDGDVAGVEPQVLELLKALRLDQLRDVEPLRLEARRKGLEARPPLRPGEIAQVLAAVEQNIVEAHECRVLPEHLLADILAAEPLLECVEARRGAAVDV